MAKAKFYDILLRQRVVSQDQLAEAHKIAKATNKKLHDELVRLGYATGEEVMRAMAQEHNMDFINLADVSIPPSVIEILPESVARENVVLPLSEEDGSLKVILSDPLDYDTREKLRFILNRNVEVVLAPRENILEAINRYYGRRQHDRLDVARVHRHGD
jgi:type IV pilus assembly protein PilB